MPIVKMDEKGRIQIPGEIRQAWHLKPKAPLLVEVGSEVLSVRRVGKPTPRNDRVLRDIVKRPLHRKGLKVTRELLERMKDEVWSA